MKTATAMMLNDELTTEQINELAKSIANQDVKTGYTTDWHHAYENAWDAIEQNPDLFTY